MKTRKQPDSPLPASLRRLPLLGELAPAPQVPLWGMAATYRVRLQARPACIGGTAACFEAVLPDAAT